MTRLFPHLLHRSKRARNSRTHRRRLLLEQLEARSLLATFSVVNGDNAGIGSLRQAILDANASAGADLIHFNVATTDANHVYYKNDGVAGQVTFANIFTTIASDDSTIADIDPDWAHSWYRIKPTTALPNVTDPVTIDGYTQPGSSPNTLAVGDNASLKIELNGVNANLYGAGLVIAAGSSTVRGLVIDGFTGNGIELQTNGGNVVEGNFIGTDVTGTVGLGNGIYGVIATSGSTNNRIGSYGASDFAGRNIIFASRRTAGLEGFYYLTGAGIYLASDQNVVAGNYIGTDVTGTQGLGGAGSFTAGGVTIDGGHSNNQIGSSGLGTDNVGQRNVIAGNYGNGVFILSNGNGVNQNNVVAGNYIGTNATGTLSVPNAGTGVHLSHAAGNTIVSNLISGNDYHGIFLDSAHNTVIAGNKIGTDVTGTVALGNGLYGIGAQEIGGGNNLIGGASAAQRNLISGNRRDGISINGCLCTTIPGPFAVIQGNYIGTDVTGTQALANVGAGVGLSGYKITVGGPGAGNLISGNTGGGITLDGGSEYVIQGNFIGTNAAGTAQIGNGPGQGIYAGVAVYGGAGIIVFNGTQNAIIGGTIAGAGNLISGNNTAGIVIGGNNNPVGPTGTQVQGNRIGTDVTGAAPMGNGGFGGIFVWHGATNTLIGGTAIGASNTIAFNLADGVKVMDSGTGNAIEGNSIHSNTRLGINLVGGGEDAFGVTPNDLGDADTGPNNLQNYPLLSSAIVSGGGTTIQGTLNSTPTTTFRLEFFANAAGDPSGYGEGQTFLGSTTVTTDSSGNATFVASLPMAAAVGQFVSSTATDANNNTSEFSGVRLTTACVELPSLVVTTSADVIAPDCVTSLREAINYANSLSGQDTITFNIPGSGVHTIQPLSALPTISSPVTIDGYSQPGSSVNTLPNGDNAVLKIELSGSNAAGVVSGLVISAGNSTVRGLAIYSFTNRGIQIGGPGGNVIEGNFIGTDATGLVRRGNNAGVSIEDSGGAANLGSRVGTDADGVNDPGERNLFIGNGIGVYLSRAGIPTFATPADNNVVAGNFFGTDRTGTITNPDNIANNGDELGNDVGIRLLTSSFNTIGGTAAAARNVVSGSKFDGINIQGSGVQGNTFTAGNLIQGNFVGTDVSGTIALSNGSPAFDGFGITVGGGERNTIGGSVPGSRNIVSGNARGGIAIGDFGSVVQGNYIGTDVTGTLPLGNTGNTFFPQFGNGVVVFGIGNVIGGIATGQANLIANNVGAGVMVSGNPTSVGHSIRGNSIFANGGLGIDLAPPLTNARGVSGNDVGDGDTGPNGYQNFPVLSSALAFGSGTLISGSLNSTANSTFTLDFYANTAADPSGFGEGATYLGSAPVTTDGAGNVTFAVTVPGMAVIGAIVSSTATDPAGSTSEFSGNTNVIACSETSSFVVTTSADIVANDCVTSLREAINYANALASHDTITFNIPGSGVHTIQPTSALPTITSPVTIDGYSQPGSSFNTLPNGDNAVLQIELDGSNVSAGNQYGLHITAGSSTVKGLAINRFGWVGIRLENAGSNVITGNFIGTDVTGTQARGNGIHGIGLYLSNDNVIGTNSDGVADAAERNVVAGSSVGIRGEFSDRNVIAGNYVGTDRNGTSALPNSEGIWMLSSASNTIGGVSVASRNLVSGNLYYGIHIQGNGGQYTGDSIADHNVVQGNFVGTEVSGTLALPNGGFGMLINSNDNTVGGATTGARNLVSANGTLVGGDGIQVIGHRNTVQGNYVGTDVSGTLPLGNSGGTYFMQGNGISVQGTGNTIGGTAAGQGNLSANNAGAGVLVTLVSGSLTGTAGNTVRGNSIFANGGLGIDLAPLVPGGAGVTANDPGDGDTGPNGYQNFPLLAAAQSSGGGTTITGSLNSTPSTTFTLDFYANAAGDPSGYGEGQTFLGSSTVTTDSSGNATFLASLPMAAAVGQFVSSTATDPGNNTSEFSGVRITTACVESSSLVVTTSADVIANDCVTSLREAITYANSNPAPDVITFNIPGSGVHTIQPLSALPTITSPVTINGYSQPGSIQNTDTPSGGNNAVLQIELDGSLAGDVSGLVITAGNSTVRGLVINRFRHDGIQLQQGDGNVIEGNYIGTDPTGTVELGNGSGGFGEGSSGWPGAGGADYFGVLIGSRVYTSDSAYGSSSNRIGTNGDGASDAAERNLISGNDGGDIAIVGVGSDSNVVAGNLIGTNAAGTMSLSLSSGTVGEGLGVLVGSGAQFNRIGTDGNGVADALERNVISGHTGSATTADQHTRSNGVVLFKTQNNIVAGNYIGTDVTGTKTLANGGGLKLLSAQRNRIGTDSNGSGDAAERNVISGNGVAISMDGASGNLVAGNFIGTDVTGMTALPNGPFINVTSVGAITLTNSLSNTIGGASVAARNVISGNGATGIFIQTSIVPTSNSIQGNFIGTDVTGMRALGNAGHGILIAGGGAGPSKNSIAGNVISANSLSGVYILGFDNVVQGNFIGTDVTGTVDLGNLNNGVLIEVTDAFHTATNNLIGGVTPQSRNIISGNQLSGVKITGVGSTGNLVQGNYIGTDITGNSALANSADGVLVDENAASNIIGGTSSGAGNVIWNNGGDGVRILSGAGNTVRHNSIDANGGLGIDLGTNGVTANDAGDGDSGANNLQNFPVLTSVASSASNTIVQGTLNSTANSSFVLEFFANAAGDPSGFGEGQQFIGSGVITTDGVGNAIFAFTLPTAVAVSQLVSSTATLLADADSNPATPAISSDTSEFSGLRVVTLYVPATISGLKFNDLNGNGVRDTTVSTASIMVPGTADPWLAGMPAGSTASGLPGNPGAGHDVAPNQSPVLVPGSVVPGTAVTFNVTGSVDHCGGGCPGAPPDGVGLNPHYAGAENGISDVSAPTDSLIGVFLGPNPPNLLPAPGSLDFGTAASRDYLTLSPLLQQTFFIGDGRTSANQVQQIVVPAGATRLFLGTMDGFGWFNNTGSFSVVVNLSSTEPVLPGWTIQLDAGANGTVDDTRITDTNGNYTFTSLEPGTYRVREVAQSGWTQTTPNPEEILVSASGQSFAGVDFGNHRTAACTPQSTELRSHWKADGNALDSADGNNGTLVGGVTFVPGQFGQAFNFDGTDYVQVPDAPNLNPNSAITVEGWIRPVFAGRPAFSADTDTIITKLTPGLNGFGLFVAMDSSFPFYQAPPGGVPLGTPAFFVATGSGIVQVFSPTPLPNDGQFHHVAGTFDGANVRLFVDGIEVISSAQTGALITTGANLFIGADFSAFSRLSRAAIDDVNLYGRALSSCEIGGTVLPSGVATITGRKFEDHDGDGTQDSEDQGLSGWTIFLDNGNGKVDLGERSTVTDATGNYAFANVQPGTYQVRELPQGGWVLTTPIASVNTSAGGNLVADLGNFHTIKVSGQKFEDHDANGVKDAGDQGLGNWTATLFRWTNDHFEGIRSTTTAPDGTYSFDGIGPGLWAVDEVHQAGWTRTNSYPQFAARSGENVNGADLANFRGITLTGKKFEDHNGNGVQDAGDQGLPGWTIFIDHTHNGHADENEPTFITGPDGSYTIPADFLPPGNYSIRESGVPGWRQTFPQSGGYEIAVGGLNGARSGVTISNRNFGNIHLAAISGQKFHDVDGNGIWQAGEPGLRFWPIFLDDNRNGSYEPGEPITWTNADGNYSFSVEPGTYVVREVQQVGWIQTTTNPASITVNEPGQVFAGRDFGNDRDDSKTLISGRKFWDVDQDGVKDVGEPGLRYWPIYLDTNNDGSHQAGEPITWSDWNGVYGFAGVEPGTYRVREIQQNGWTQTTANPADVVVTANGQTFVNVDFGNRGSNGPGPGVNPPTDLEVIKGALQAIAGEQITYTLRVTNRGPANSYGVILGDQLPAGLVYELATPSQGTCFGTQTIICAVGPLAVNESATVTIVAHVLSWVVDEVENEGCVYSTATDTDPANNCAISRTPIGRSADLQLIKTADSRIAIAGQNLTYTMRVRNDGPSDSTNVTLEDELPPEVTFVSASSPHGTCTTEVTSVTTVVCDLGTVANGETAVVTLVVHVADWVLDDTIIINDASVASPWDPNSGNDRSTTFVPCGRAADLILTKTGPYTSIDAQVYYVLEVTNHGPSNSTGAIVGDHLPPNINFLSAVASQGICNFNGATDVLLCNLGPMLVGQSETVTVYVGVPETVVIADVRNEGFVWGIEGDPAPWNNYGGAGGVIRYSSIGVVKDAPPTIIAGETLTYTLHVTNEGPDNSSNVIVGDTLPPGVVLVSATPTQGSCYAYNPIICFLGALAVNQSADVTIVVYIPPTLPEGMILSNTAFGYGGLAPFPGWGHANTRVRRVTDIDTVKIAPEVVVAGTEMTYTLRTRNRGPSEATNITLVDELPANVRFVRAVPSQGTCSDTLVSGVTTVSCALGNVAAMAVATVDIVVFVPSLVVAGTIIGNGYCAYATEFDSNLLNNCFHVNTAVTENSDLELIKTTPPGPVIAGENIQYTLEVHNRGPSDGRGIILGDTLPAPLVFVSATATQGTCNFSSGVVLCDIGYLPVGQSQFVTITAFVPPSTPDGTIIENTACIVACGHDIVHANDCSTVRTTIRAQGILTGQVYHDHNGNALKESGDNGLPAWTVYLDDNLNDRLDPGERTTLTNGGGNYFFTGLGKSTYRVREVVQGGWTQTTANPADVLVSGRDKTFAGGDFGNFKRIYITGNVFNDLNASASKNPGEPGLVSWTVFVDANQNGLLDGGERNTLSDPAGNYRFVDLGPGSYSIREVLQPGWTQTTPNPAPIIASSGVDVTGVDFGNFKRFVITGQKFHDFNNSGSKDVGEPGLSGWTIFIDANSNGALDMSERSTVTDVAGNYRLVDLGPGSYTIREVSQTGWTQTTPNPAPIVGLSGRDVANVDFGNRRSGTPAKITGGGSIDQSVRNFGFVVMPTTQGGVTTYFGSLEFQDKSLGYNLKATAITFINIESDRIHGQFTGTATLNGVAGYLFYVELEDRAEPGALVDKFRIRITGPGGFTYDSNTYATKGGLLDKGGNIQIHKTSSLTADTSPASPATSQDVDTHSLRTGVLVVAIHDQNQLGASQLARIQDAIYQVNDSLSPLGANVLLVNASSGVFADVHLNISQDSLCGGMADGVLGCATDDGDITLIAGWDWFLGSDIGDIGSKQFDLQTLVTHELGHAIGLGHASDSKSPMYALLAAGQSRRDLTSHDVALLGNFESEGAETRRSVTAVVSERSHQRNDSARGLFDDLQYVQSLGSNRRSFTVNSSPDQYVRRSMKSNDGSRSSSRDLKGSSPREQAALNQLPADRTNGRRGVRQVLPSAHGQPSLPVDLDEWSFDQILDSLVSDPKRVS